MSQYVSMKDFKLVQHENVGTVTQVSDSFVKLIEKYKDTHHIQKKRNEYEAKIIVNDKSTEILVGCIHLDNAQMEFINSELLWIYSNVNDVKKQIAKSLLVMKNENWIVESEKSISNEIFIDRIGAIKSINIDEKGIILTFDDNDLFWGHSIQVSIKNKKKFEVELIG